MTVKLKEEETGAAYDLVYDGESFHAAVATPKNDFYEMEISFSRLDPETNAYANVEKTHVIFSFDFSSEFNFFDDSTNTLLYQLSSQGGGSLLPEEDIHFDIGENQLSDAQYESAMVWFLLAAVILYLADIAIRKTIFCKKAKKPDTQVPENYF